MSQFNVIKICIIFTKQYANSCHNHMDYKPGDTGMYPGDMKQGAKISWPKGIEIIQNLLFV